jgi:tetratricopeptide (TPR) repeat protein
VTNIELHKSFLGEGLVGNIDSEPGLSWSDHRALADAAQASRQMAQETSAIRQRLESVSLGVAAVGQAIAAMEYELGFRLQTIANILEEQLNVLESIAQALRTPAKTRAAERLVDVAELLRRGRWERALAISRAAIEDDPNNPAGFLAAGWAHMGLSDLDQAREAFIEAADASDGAQRSSAGRQAARLTLALQDAQTALSALDRYGVTSAPRWSDCLRWEGAQTPTLVEQWWEQQRELGAVHYDRAVYLAANEALEESALELEKAGGIDPRFFAMSLADTQLAEHDRLVALAASKLSSALFEQRATVDRQIERLRTLADQIVDLNPRHTDLQYARKLIDELAGTLGNDSLRNPPQLLLDDLFVEHLRDVVHELESEEVQELQAGIKQEALALADRLSGCVARPAPSRTVEVSKMRLQVWEVEKPRSGFMRTSRVWLISTDGIETNIIKLR